MSSDPRHAIGRLPTAPGVYRFRDTRGRVLYVGRATDLRHRVASYWSDLGERAHLATMVRRVGRIEAVACDSGHEAAWLERNLLETTLPPWNRTPGGQEVPVYIRLDSRPRKPSLNVVHLTATGDGMRDFGPYLGGRQVRLAVSGLHRILPLAYTGTSLRGGELDMARRRDVSHLDRAWIVDALTAVLARNADAVGRARGALGELRDRAAESQVFELAGRIQAESHALDWVTSPQRVTVEGSEDLDAYGWSEGTLVHYGVRSGRLCAWSQRPCSRTTATPMVEATPGAWVDFAQRNADLAAALARAPA